MSDDPFSLDHTTQDFPTHANGVAPAEILTQLSVADVPFAATGMAHVRVTRDGAPHRLAIPIKSVELDAVEQAVHHLRPQIPTYRDHVKGKWITVFDEANTAYQQKMATYQRATSYAWVLMALDVDVVDAQRQVVWSRDNTVRKLDEAVAALKAMGLVDNQLVSIFRDIQALTGEVEKAADQD